MVLSFDRYSRDDVMGEVMVEMEGMDFSNSEACPLSLVREITPRFARIIQATILGSRNGTVRVDPPSLRSGCRDFFKIS